MTPLILVTGGVKSGKSQFAADCLSALTEQPLIIATARRLDAELSARIDRHLAARPKHWQTLEAPIALPEALANEPRPALVDCLGVWLTNILFEQPQTLEQQIAELIDALQQRTAATVLVSNECGLGVIGADAFTRNYVDQLGLLNQAVARYASHVVLTVAGLPQWLKGEPL